MKKLVILSFHVALTLLFLAPALLCAQEKRIDSVTKLIIKDQDDAKLALAKQDFSSAIKRLAKASELANTIDNDTLAGQVILSSAILHYYVQNYELANKETDAAINIFKPQQNDIELGRAFTIKGLIATRLKQYDTSEVYLKRADNIFLNENNDEQRSNVLLGYGILEYERGNYVQAVNYLDASITTFKTLNKKYQLSFALLQRSKALLLLDSTSSDTNVNKAEKSINEALIIVNSNNYQKLKTDSYEARAMIAKKRGDLAESVNYLEKFSAAKDDYFQNYIEVISSSYEDKSVIVDLETALVKSQDELKKSGESNNFIKMTTGLSIALIIILSLLTLSLYKNNNLRAKANNLLQDKNTELQLSKEKAEKASLAKAQFLSTVTHELRTPLYAVTGLTHLLLDEDPKEHQKEHLNSLKFSGEYLLSLINNILDLNKLEANKVEVEKTSFNLKKRINDVLIALKKSANDKKNQLHLEFDESIPSKLKGDPLKLSQILINLVGNSLKFTQNGDVTVRVQKINQTEKRVMLHFEIEDNGVGISQKKQKSIFESFSQASLQINRKFGGTGLGLSIVKNLLELMNSKIQLESQLGKGSKFWFNLAIDTLDSDHKDAVSKTSMTDDNFSYLENKNVLVVEDNKINQMITRKILEKNKLNCQVADNGLDAVKLVEENNFDIVLMDIHMPGISGVEATQKIRKFDTALPIIALTAVTIDENLDEFYKAGFNDIIPKPFKTETFFETIHKTLTKSSEV